MGLAQLLHPKSDSDGDDGAPAAAAAAGPQVVATMADSEPPDFNHAVNDATWLLMYAAETGRKVDDATRLSVLHARTVTSTAADEAVTSNLLIALTKLASDLSPVTADSLRASRDKEAKPTVKSLQKFTMFLAIPIILFSVLGFISSSISTAIRTDITTANELLIKLRQELGTGSSPKGGVPGKPIPAGLNEGDVLTQLQQYASTIRAIDARSLQLDVLVFNRIWDPFAQYRWDPKDSAEIKKSKQATMKSGFELPVPLERMPDALDTLTITYQNERSFAQNILDMVTVSYGAITTCLLPVLYALLGTCAYLLRSFEEELRTLTFTPSSRANLARFLIAGIGGAVVGLFSNFDITQGASISPLAIAFLVGYAVDVFFSFLEGLLQAFSKRSRPIAATHTPDRQPSAG